MNKMDTLLESLQRQQAQIDDPEAFTDRVMERMYAQKQERGGNTYPATIVSPLSKGDAGAANNSQFIVRAAASVALVVLVGLFVMLHTQPVGSAELLANNRQNIDKYRIDTSEIPTDGTAREMYRCYQEAKREQTFYHNELIKYTHENL
jgi:hypothetical protein